MTESDFPAHKAGMTLDHNDHHSSYMSAADRIKDLGDWCDWESEEAKQRAIDTDSIWTLQWYPQTPIGFLAVAAPTLAEVMAYAKRVEKMDNEAHGR